MPVEDPGCRQCPLKAILILDLTEGRPVASIVGVHGIRNFSYYSAARDLTGAMQAIEADWQKWLGEGCRAYDPLLAGPSQMPVAYYADLLDRGTGMGAARPDTLEPFARALFLEWAEQTRVEAAESNAPAPVPAGRVTAALRQAVGLLTDRYGARCIPVITALVAELATYFDPRFADRRRRCRERVADAVRTHRPRGLVTHSLGSVVAYEALCSAPDLRVDLLVTLGSPLAMRNVVFDRLEPPPAGKGIRPPGVGEWWNLSDKGDPVAAPRRALPLRFDGVWIDRDITIHRFDPHRVKSYLRCREIAEVLAPHL
ncbi:serine peptidase [Actinomadura graeca]|uniref:Serine peptidase n=1 Tax=Actinomadura graeca TaxID=2750812 RepID=A0ABX8QZS6_9ACTN|nr:GPI inositol-deacylase [Actinomadura graeca]QXJ23831.1 serine peptidase [Actinomadura graeca]